MYVLKSLMTFFQQANKTNKKKNNNNYEGKQF